MNDVELDPLDCSSDANCVNLLAQARAYEGLIRALYPHSWYDICSRTLTQLGPLLRTVVGCERHTPPFLPLLENLWQVQWGVSVAVAHGSHGGRELGCLVHASKQAGGEGDAEAVFRRRVSMKYMARHIGSI